MAEILVYQAFSVRSFHVNIQTPPILTALLFLPPIVEHPKGVPNVSKGEDEKEEDFNSNFLSFW